MLAALQDVALAYLRRDAGTPSRSGAWPVSRPTPSRLAPAGRRPSAAGHGVERHHARESLPGAGSLPGTDHPVGRDRPRRRPHGRAAAGRAADRRPGRRRPHDLRPAHRRPRRRRHAHAALAALPRCRPCGSSPPPATSTTASRPSSSPSPAPTPTASPRRSAAASPSTSASPTPRCRRARRSPSSTCPATSASSRTCWPGWARSTPACSWWPPPRAGSRSREEHLRILELLGVGHGVVALTKVDLVDDEQLELARLDVADHVAGTFLEAAADRAGAAPAGAGLDDLRARPRRAGRHHAGGRRPRPPPPVGRPGVRRQGRRDGGDRARSPAARLAVGDQVVVGPAARPARVRAIQSLGEGAERIGPGHRVALNLSGVEHDRGGPGRRRRPARAVAAHGRFDASPARAGRPRPRGVPAGRLPRPTSARASTRCGSGCSAAGDRARAHGLVRLHLATPVPLLPGDRYVLRESGRERDGRRRRGARRGAGPAGVEGPARPLGATGWWPSGGGSTPTSWRRSPASAGPPTSGRGWPRPGAVAALVEAVVGPGRGGRPARPRRRRARRARARGCSAACPTAVVVDGRARPAPAPATPLADHPFLAALEAAGRTPPPPDGVDRAELRELVRRGLVVERDGVLLRAVGRRRRGAGGRPAAGRGSPTGSRWRSSATRSAATRKHAVPLLARARRAAASPAAAATCASPAPACPPA